MLEVCDRVSSSEENAKEAAKALRREFKCVHRLSALSMPVHAGVQGWRTTNPALSGEAMGDHATQLLPFLCEAVYIAQVP